MKENFNFKNKRPSKLFKKIVQNVCVCLCSVYCKIIQKMYKKTKTVYKCVQKVIYIDEFKLKLKKKSDIYIKNICILFQLTLTIHQINT